MYVSPVGLHAEGGSGNGSDAFCFGKRPNRYCIRGKDVMEFVQKAFWPLVIVGAGLLVVRAVFRRPRQVVREVKS